MFNAKGMSVRRYNNNFNDMHTDYRIVIDKGYRDGRSRDSDTP